MRRAHGRKFQVESTRPPPSTCTRGIPDKASGAFDCSYGVCTAAEDRRLAWESRVTRERRGHRTPDLRSEVAPSDPDLGVAELNIDPQKRPGRN